jgi:hypothetical protein
MNLPPFEQLHASAVRFLIDGGEEEAAQILLSCSLQIVQNSVENFGQWEEAVQFKLTGPRAAFDILDGYGHPMRAAIERALTAVLPDPLPVAGLVARAELIVADQNWREELLEIARGRGVDNQVAEASKPIQLRTWANLRFRSESEVRVAQALDRAGVLFLPNCKARLGLAANRLNREADFLVCADGKWGILEVDGEPFHPPSRAAQDHERDRLFHQHGILIIEHYDATHCFQKPDEVVASFLSLLRRA